MTDQCREVLSFAHGPPLCMLDRPPWELRDESLRFSRSSAPLYLTACSPR
jgi:hypothetical protein